MKRRLNILCVLVILVLGYSVIENLYQVGMGVSQGVEMGMKAGIRSCEQSKPVTQDVMFSTIRNMKPVALMPEVMYLFSDSVYNAKTGKYIPALYSQLAVSIPVERNEWHMLITTLSPFIHMFSIIIAVIFFMKVIISINKSEIFNWKNVRRLRWLGGALVICFLAEMLPIYITYIELSGVLEIRGYSFHMSEMVSVLTLVLGIVAFIIAEVFAIGLRMQEEQELTI